MQISDVMANAALDFVQSFIGSSPKIVIYGGVVPASANDVDTGQNLVTFTLAAVWAQAASSRNKPLTGLPIIQNGATTGYATHYRVTSSDLTQTFFQGLVGDALNPPVGADLLLDNILVSQGLPIRLVAFSLAL